MGMFEVSGSMSVSREGAVLADALQLALRVEALSPGNLSKKLVSLASISSTFHKEVQIKGTHTVNPRTTSNARSGTGSMLGWYADGSLAVHPVPSENIPGRPLVVVLGPELPRHQTIYVLIDTGARLDSGCNSLVSRADSDSDVAVAEQAIGPKGTVTFQEGAVSTATTIAISFTVSVLLSFFFFAYLTGPGEPQMGLNLVTVVLMDGVWIFIFSVTFQLAFNTDAPLLGATGHVALARIPRLLISVASWGVHSNFALCFTGRVGASPEWALFFQDKRCRALSLDLLYWGESGHLPEWALFFQDKRCRAHVLVPGSIGSGNPPTSLTYRNEVAVVVDEGALLDLAGHETASGFRSCLLRCACSRTLTQAIHNADRCRWADTRGAKICDKG